MQPEIWSNFFIALQRSLNSLSSQDIQHYYLLKKKFKSFDWLRAVDEIVISVR